MKKASHTLLFTVALCATALTAVGAVTQARVTSSAAEGVYIEGVVSLRGIPFVAAPTGAPYWKVTEAAAARGNFTYDAKWHAAAAETRIATGGAVVVSFTYRIGPFLRHS